VRRLALIGLVTVIAAVGVGQSWSAQDVATKRSIRIVKATNDHGVIRLTVRITDWKMYPRLVGKAPKPDGGHWRIYVNGRYNNLSTSATSGSTNPRRALTPGSYVVDARLARNSGKELSPPVRSNRVTVTVEEPAETTE
jgi:hypothetical protein